jgi:SAM-dependent methyltransferase
MTSLTDDNDALAAAYDRLSDSQFESGKRLVDALEIQAGHRVLDVGCGTGRLARFIAERVGESGEVVGVDPLERRIEIARAHAPKIRFAVAQAEDLGLFPDASFDRVVMSAVFHWVKDKPKALAEVKRVLCPQGRFGATTLPRDLMESSSMSHVLGPILREGPYAARLDLTAIASLIQGVTVSELITLVRASGLELAALHVMPRERPHRDARELVDFMDASTFGNFFRIVPEDMRGRLRDDLIAAFEARRQPEGIIVRDWGLSFLAIKP